MPLPLCNLPPPLWADSTTATNTFPRFFFLRLRPDIWDPGANLPQFFGHLSLPSPEYTGGDTDLKAFVEPACFTPLPIRHARLPFLLKSFGRFPYKIRFPQHITSALVQLVGFNRRPRQRAPQFPLFSGRMGLGFLITVVDFKEFFFAKDRRSSLRPLYDTPFWRVSRTFSFPN